MLLEHAESDSLPHPRTFPLGLSGREVEVLHCIAAGLSTTEIAQTLFISTATVKRPASPTSWRCAWARRS